MKPLAGVLRALPAGTLLVGAGMAALGGASYIHLAVAGHALDAEGNAGVSVLWTIIFSIGLGLFFPVEQEITRIVAARAARGEGVTPVLRRGALLALGMLVLVLVAVAAASGPIADRLFDGDRSLLFALGGAFCGLAAVALSRGVLAGHGAFKAYGIQLGIDGGIRIVLAVVLGLTGNDSPLMFSLILTVAPLTAALITLPPVLRLLKPGPEVPWRELCHGLGLLTASTLLAQLMVNMAVMSVKVLKPGETALVSALLAAVILARVPLFVFGSLQASLLPGLARLADQRQRAEFRTMLLRAGLVVCALGVAGGVCATALGPWLVTTFFDAAPVLHATDFALLSFGTLCYMLAMVLGQGVMAMGGHKQQLVAWAAGSVVLLAVTILPGDIRIRVEIAYAAGSATVALLMAVMLRFGVRRWQHAPASGGGPVPGGTTQVAGMLVPE